MTARTDVAALKAKLADPEFVCAALGLAEGAKPQANGLIVRCPWCEGAYQLCSVWTGDDGMVRTHCRECGVNADVLGLIAQVKGLNTTTEFRQVLKAADPTPTKDAPQPKLQVETFNKIASTMLAAAPISAAPKVGSYLADRRLLELAVADGWGGLPESPAALGAIIHAVLETVGPDAWKASGLASDEGGIMFPEHSVIVPWRDDAGRITTLQRRLPDPAAGARKYVMPSNRPATHPYGIGRFEAERGATDVAFVEGASDTLGYRALCAAHGLDRVVLGVPGTSGWRPDWAEYARGRVVYVAFDADEAGDLLALRVNDDLHHTGALRVLRHRPRGAKDWAEQLAGSSR